MNESLVTLAVFKLSSMSQHWLCIPLYSSVICSVKQNWRKWDQCKKWKKREVCSLTVNKQLSSPYASHTSNFSYSANCNPTRIFWLNLIESQLRHFVLQALFWTYSLFSLVRHSNVPLRQLTLNSTWRTLMSNDRLLDILNWHWLGLGLLQFFSILIFFDF